LLGATCALFGAQLAPSLSRRTARAAEAAAENPHIQTVDTSDAFGGKRSNLQFAGHAAFIIRPAGDAGAEPQKWVWFAPTFPGLPGPRHDFIIRHALRAGMAFAGINVGESYGSPAGVKLYADFHDALVGQFHLSAKAVLLPQSRGGLMLYNWAADYPKQVEHIAGIYTVCDLRSYPGLATAAPAYGLSEKQLSDALARCNPIDRLSPLAHAGIPILHIHGDNDHVVPLEKNSAELARRYRALGGTMELIVVPGKGHEEVDEFFISDRFVTFLTTGK
jgi:pimeloyl-ACP methyl ester carboxylesterase